MKKILFLSFFVPFFGTAQVITDGLVGYWPFNGNANDESGNGYHGEVMGTTLVPGKDNNANTAYHLSREKYIDLGDEDVFDFGAGEFSVAVWINKTNSNTNWNMALVNKWNNGGKPGTNEWHLGSGAQRDDVPNFVIEIGNTRYRTLNTEPLTLNTWYHLVAVKRTTSVELYINGVLKSSVQVPAGAINNVGRSLNFGKFGGVNGTGTYYNQGAKIDDVMLFNRALTPQEVVTIYSGAPEGAVPDAVEYQALVDFYNSTNGENWDNNSNWLSGSTINDMASWYGVTVQNGDVRKISLAVNNLTGELPASLGNLTKLDWLHLGANSIGGSIPAQIGNLKALTRLYLNNNNFSGQIPTSIEGLTQLSHLYLGLNNLTGVLPENIGNLTKLQYLYLNDNHLSGRLPLSTAELKSLKSFYLENNSLTGEMPESIGNLDQVAHLNFSNNALTGSIPSSITKCTNLKTISLNYNNLSGQIPTDIDQISQLEKLYLRGNSLSGTIPENIGNLSNLRNLMIDGNNLTGSIPETLGNCKKLYYLYLQSNNLTGSIPASLGNLKELWQFYANSNQLTGELPDSVGGMTNLIRLYLSNNNLTGTLPSSIANLKKLQKLALNNNQFKGPIPKEINTLENLISVAVYKNNLTSFPDFSAHPNRHQMQVTVYTNKLKFASLEQNFSSAGTHVFSHFSYHTQTPFPADTLAFTVGQNVILDTEDHAPHNKFQWQRLLNGKWVDIDGETSGTLSIAAITGENATSYRCRITNDWVNNLTIYSRTSVLQTTLEFWSVADGNWTTDRIWSTTKGGAPITGYPQGGSKVFVVGNNVTLNTNLSCGPLEVIVENAEASLTVDGAEVTVHGEVKLTKTTEGYPGNIKVVNGGKVRPIE